MPRPGVRDPYREQARAQGYLSRAVFKLKAVDEKFRLLKPGQRVLDLGCSPGSWLQYLAARVGPRGLVVGVDLEPPDVPLAPPLHFLQGDVASLDLAAIRRLCPDFDAVVSDMAPRTTGIREVDQARSLALARLAWDYAREFLKNGGHFLVKVFEGPDTAGLSAEMKTVFALVHRVKPPASRQESGEIYLLGLNRGGRPPQIKRRHRAPTEM